MFQAIAEAWTCRQRAQQWERIAIRAQYSGCPHRHWLQKRGGKWWMICERPTSIPSVRMVLDK